MRVSLPALPLLHFSHVSIPPTDLAAIVAADVARALAEDVGSGDLTAQLVPAGRAARAHVLVREPAVLCGKFWFERTFHELDASIEVQWLAREGDAMQAATRACALAGDARALLTGERTALNFLQLLSATATQTRRYVEAIAGTEAHTV